MKSRKRKTNQIVTNSEKIVNFIKAGNTSFDELLEFINTLPNTFFDSAELEFELLLTNGMPLEIIDDKIVLKTSITNIEEQTFCIVDIETNGSNVNKGQVIELGAVKLKNGEIIDKFDSLVYAREIPRYIQEVTQITPKMLEDAPPLQKVLKDFKLFLGDDVFIAHDIKFDYKFISQSFEKYDLGKLENRKLCTIDLSKRTIKAKRYGLDYLKELLDVQIDIQHRAYSDALSTAYILKKNFVQLPKTVITVEDLITYSKSDNIIKSTKKGVEGV